MTLLRRRKKLEPTLMNLLQSTSPSSMMVGIVCLTWFASSDYRCRLTRASLNVFLLNISDISSWFPVVFPTLRTTKWKMAQLASPISNLVLSLFLGLLVVICIWFEVLSILRIRFVNLLAPEAFAIRELHPTVFGGYGGLSPVYWWLKLCQPILLRGLLPVWLALW